MTKYLLICLVVCALIFKGAGIMRVRLNVAIMRSI